MIKIISCQLKNHIRLHQMLMAVMNVHKQKCNWQIYMKYTIYYNQNMMLYKNNKNSQILQALFESFRPVAPIVYG